MCIQEKIKLDFGINCPSDKTCISVFDVGGWDLSAAAGRGGCEGGVGWGLVKYMV